MESTKDAQNQFVQKRPLALSRLNYKISKLQLALKNKESELSKLQASTKSTSMHEMKLQTQVYYDEILRLLSQINLLQDTQNLGEEEKSCEEKVDKKQQLTSAKEKVYIREQQASSKREEKLLTTIVKLQDENKILVEKIDELKKAKLELEKEVRNESESGKETRNDSEVQCDLLNTSSSDICKDCVTELKQHIDLLQKREAAWEEEKSAYKTILNSLDEDRHFYQKISEDKHIEVDNLQSGLLKLNNEIKHLHTELENLPQKIPVCQSCPPKKFLENSCQTKDSAETSTVSESMTSPTPSKSKSNRKLKHGVDSRRNHRKETIQRKTHKLSQVESPIENGSSSFDSGENQTDAVHHRLSLRNSKSSPSQGLDDSPSKKHSEKTLSSVSQESKSETENSVESSKTPTECGKGNEEYINGDENAMSQPQRNKAVENMNLTISTTVATKESDIEPQTSARNESAILISAVTLGRESDIDLDRTISQTLIQSDQQQYSYAKNKLRDIIDGHVVRSKMVGCFGKTAQNQSIDEKCDSELKRNQRTLTNILDAHITRMELMASRKKTS